MKQFFPLFINVVVPLLAGLVYFALARYVRQIGPLRTLVTGKLTYEGAFWGFLMFGTYLGSRPLQVFLGPHPLPLIVNCLREFLMIAIFAPSVTVAMMSLTLGSANVPKKIIRFLFGFGFVNAALFSLFNVKAIGGSEVIFTVGPLTAYDGVWFHQSQPLMAVLFLLRLLDPVLMIFGAGTLVLWAGFNYPIEKKILYDNMPRKFFFMGAACYAFSLSMLSVGFLYLVADIPNQWWIYYVGALAAGLLETISLSLPLRRFVQITEHK